MPDWPGYVRERLPPLPVSPPREREIVAELAEQLEQAYQEALAVGADAADARRRAEAEIADWPALASALAAAEAPLAARVPAGVREALDANHLRAHRGGNWLADLLQDLRYALRGLRRNPGFTAVAVLTLALGIGANTAIFSLVSPVLFQALPYPRAGRIVDVAHVDRGEVENNLSGMEGMFLASHQHSMSALALVDDFGASNLSGAGAAARVGAVRVTHEYFQVFGVRPVLGRGFTAADDAPGAPLVAVISDGLWHAQFDADPEVVGRTFRLNDQVYTVIGVMPPSFTGFRYTFSGVAATDLWTDLQPTSASLAPLGPNLDVVGQLRDGVTLAQANADLALQYAAFRRVHPASGVDRLEWGALPYRNEVVGDTRMPLLLLLGAVGLVLVIACANVATLLLARASARSREMALRAAIGAGWGRLARQALTESLMLALFGAACGWLLALWMTPVLQRLTPATLTLPVATGLNLRVLVFTVGLVVVTGALFGLVPVWGWRPRRLAQRLQAGGNGATGRGRSRGILVAAEVAVAFVLLVGAGLLGDSLLRLYRVDPGFDVAGVLTAQTTLTGAYLASDAATTRYTERVLERLREIPGVLAAASITGVPLTRAMNYSVSIPGHADDPSLSDVEWRAVSPGYLGTVGIKLAGGRDFARSDNPSAPKVAIVSRNFARREWPARRALGQTVSIPDPNGHGQGTLATIIGVAADIHENGVNAPAPLTVYVPQAQASDAINALVNHWFAMGFVIRGRGTELPAAVRQAFAGVDANQPVFNVVSLNQLKGDALGNYRYLAWLLGVFAAVALLLSCIGIYGVSTYAVERRRREIGIRMALGAERRRILRQFIAYGLRWAGTGVVIGVAGALASTRVLSGMLYGVTPTDPLILAAMALGLLVLAGLAGARPAWRAARVRPWNVLREE